MCVRDEDLIRKLFSAATSAHARQLSRPRQRAAGRGENVKQSNTLQQQPDSRASQRDHHHGAARGAMTGDDDEAAVHLLPSPVGH